MKKLTLEQAIEAFSGENLSLLSNSYVNGYTKLRYKCNKCGYVGGKTLNTLKCGGGGKGTGCPSCKHTIPTEMNNILKTHSHLLQEWDPDKNTVNLNEVTYGSGVILWWICKKESCGYSWKTAVRERARKVNPTGCPVCANRVVTELNNLKSLLPGLSEEWDEEKNGDLKPEEVTCGSNKKVWWRCKKEKCRHSWKAMVNSRAHKRIPTGCPACSKRPISKPSQEWLDSLNIKIREHYIKDLKFRVDGYDPKTDTVYEFLGNYWHGNPEMFSPKEVNPTNKRSFGELHQEWLDRKNLLEEAGYKVVYIWEKDFKSKE